MGVGNIDTDSSDQTLLSERVDEFQPQISHLYSLMKFSLLHVPNGKQETCLRNSPHRACIEPKTLTLPPSKMSLEGKRKPLKLTNLHLDSKSICNGHLPTPCDYKWTQDRLDLNSSSQLQNRGQNVGHVVEAFWTMHNTGQNNSKLATGLLM